MKPHMKPKTANARRLAAKIVSRVLFDEAYVGLSLDSELKNSSLPSPDKAFCTELVYGTLRWYQPLLESIKRALDKPNSKIDKKILPHLLIAAYQLQYLPHTVPAYASVNSAVGEIKRIRQGLAPFANAVLRNLGSPLVASLPANTSDIDLLAKAFGVPINLAKAIVAGISAEERKIAISALNQKAKNWLKLFISEPKRATFLERLAREGFSLKGHDFVPDCFCVEKSGSPALLYGFKEGYFQVQDPSSQVAALLVAPRLGQHVLDMCAAPGSKSTILASLVGPKGKVCALDISKKRLALVNQNCDRLRLAIETKNLDATKLPEDTKFDAVLLDAPCSGLGTTRRHPEIKWRRSAEDLESLTKLQKSLLYKAAKLVSSGGALVYSVCSPMPAEGAEILQEFLASHQDFSIENAKITLPWLPESALRKDGSIKLFPHIHDADAFFAVRLKKR